MPYNTCCSNCSSPKQCFSHAWIAECCQPDSLKLMSVQLLIFIIDVTHGFHCYTPVTESKLLLTSAAQVGDMFIGDFFIVFTQDHIICSNISNLVRNAGNLVPHSRLFGIDSTTTEPAALELGCVVNNVKHYVVCGHSDCKVK